MKEEDPLTTGGTPASTAALTPPSPLSSCRRDPEAPITIYHIGEEDHPDHWWDLCAGPHVERTGSINPDAIDLESVAGGWTRGEVACGPALGYV